MSASIVCCGEVLWDVFPDGERPGGAPLNVAIHAQQLGASAAIISRVGTDARGRRLQEFAAAHGVDTGCLQTDATCPTGTVTVALSAEGQPTYDIVLDVAWDRLAASPDAMEAAANAGFFVFGSLASRTALGQQAVVQLAQAAAFPVLDLNLRAPFYSADLTRALLECARSVKVNDEEWDQLCAWFGLTEAHAFLKQFRLDWICITRGPQGASFHTAEEEFEVKGIPVDVADTVGAGDAFLAGLLSGLAQGLTPSEALERARAAGAWVASKPGATPALTLADLASLLD